ncbi:hypothetical protein K470DRAFT_262237 [Piedraia hortae CBS 480.64]|uniref:DUF4048 domain-containing protein n=1 Tax=Piedraia hortae CBS 480.64 TaxID=1314780 RepID=A0A6A7C6H3_9PEZI|nr:hypothetical protein K470DRAFT_262237 [Piedraia hortae CBS 480.64]
MPEPLRIRATTSASLTKSSASLSSPRRNKQFFGFPVQPSASSAPSSPLVPPELDFLTAIARQERRVLELKEELQKAEGDLYILKRRWALQENKRKKRALHLHVQTGNRGQQHVRVDGRSKKPQEKRDEVEKQKAALQNGKSGRTVFQGNTRHIRALSLLSPTTPTTPGVASVPANSPKKNGSIEVTQRNQPTSATSASSSIIPRERSSYDSTASTDGEGVLVRAGKQIATDFKDGFWTFWEDLRQATVGDEATVEPSPVSRRGSSRLLRGSESGASVAERPISRKGQDRPTPPRRRDSLRFPPRRDSMRNVTRPNLDPKPSLASAAGLDSPFSWVQPRQGISHAKDSSDSVASCSHDKSEVWDDQSAKSRASSATSSRRKTTKSEKKGNSIVAEPEPAGPPDGQPVHERAGDGSGSVSRSGI